MNRTETARFQMHQGLQNALGEAVANTLMDHLPPSGWSDVARRHDIEMIMMRFDMLDARIESVQDGLNTRIDGLDRRIDGLEKRIDGLDGRTKWIVTCTLAAGLALLAVQVQIMLSIMNL